MYYVNKIIAWMTSPFGIMFIGLGAGMILGRVKRWRRIGGCLMVLTLAVTWILSTGVFTRLVGVRLEGEERESEYAEDAIAIVLLGGGMGSHEKCGRAEMFGGADRVWMAARQYKRYGGVLPVFCTGGGVDISTKPLLMDFGVKEKDILWFEEPRNTEEEARLIAAKIKERTKARGDAAAIAANPKIVLVTSAWHTRRAKMLFEHQGFAVVPACTDYEMHCISEAEWRPSDFFPSADAFLRNSCVLKEYVAIACYKIKLRLSSFAH